MPMAAAELIWLEAEQTPARGGAKVCAMQREAEQILWRTQLDAEIRDEPERGVNALTTASP